MPHNEIMILLSAVSPIGRIIMDELDSFSLSYEAPREEPFSSTRLGRAVLAICRVVSDPDDYVAHRTLLGVLPRVGTKTTNDIAHAVIAHNLNYKNVFYQPLPVGGFDARCTRALARARSILAGLTGWSGADTLSARSAALNVLLSQLVDAADVAAWSTIETGLPSGITIEELRAYCRADTETRQKAVISQVRERIAGAPEEPVAQDQRIRIMTMHGAKGLSATVVFIPGLEDSFLPGARRRPYLGLVLEAARLLFVSISRARAACVMSYAHSRRIHGSYTRQAPCPFCVALGGAFVLRTSGMTAAEIGAVMASAANL